MLCQHVASRARRRRSSSSSNSFKRGLNHKAAIVEAIESIVLLLLPILIFLTTNTSTSTNVVVHANPLSEQQQVHIQQQQQHQQLQQSQQQQQQQQQQQPHDFMCRASTPHLYQQHDNKLHFKVPENAPNGTCVGHVRSADNSVPDLLIVPKRNASDPLDRDSVSDVELLFAFRLTPDGDLVTNSVLDRERREHYKFGAVCMKLFCEVSITVQVEDVNDNAPKFYVPPEQQQLPAVIPEGLSKENISSIVIRWPEGQSRISSELPMAIDLDIGGNGIQEFVLRDANSVNTVGHRIQSIFCMVEHGAPSTSHCNPPEPNDLVELPSMGSSSSGGGSGGSSGVAPPTMANDDIRQPFIQQAPVLVTSKQASHLISSSALGGLVVQGAGSSSLFSYTKNSISLVNLKPLDREQQSRYQFIAQVVDGGQPPLTGRLLVTVEVTDINDNDPIFEKSHYEIRVRENTTIGSSLLTVAAHDADLDANAQITYSLAPAIKSSSAAAAAAAASELPPAMFKIDPFRGEIILIRQLDFESEPTHELRVEARDHGQPPRSSFARLKVIVEDVDDDLPPPAAHRQAAAGSHLGETGGLTSAAAAAAHLDRQKSAGLLPSSSSSGDSSRQSVDAYAGMALDSANHAEANGQQQQQPQHLLPSSSSQIHLLPSFKLLNWFAQINSSLLFVIILVGLFAVAFSVCLVKIKSHQPESDYNDTALTLNNGQTKASPNNSISNEHSSNHHHHNSHHHQHHHSHPNNHHSYSHHSTGGGGGGAGGNNNHHHNHHLHHNHLTANGGGGVGVGGDSHHTNTSRSHQHDIIHQHLQQQHHHQQQRRSSTFAALNLGGPAANLSSISAKLRYQSHGDSSNLYYNPFQMSQPSRHHLSSHQVAHSPPGAGLAINCSGAGGGDSPNSHQVATLPLHHSGSAHQVHQQLPHTPCQLLAGTTGGGAGAGGSFSHWPRTPGSTMGCFHGGGGSGHTLHGCPNGGGGGTPVSALDCTGALNATNNTGHHHQSNNINSGPHHHQPASAGAAAAAAASSPMMTPSLQQQQQPQPLDRWFDLGVSSQLVMAQDLYGSYNWDYLADWTPSYQPLMPLVN